MRITTTAHLFSLYASPKEMDSRFLLQHYARESSDMWLGLPELLSNALGVIEAEGEMSISDQVRLIETDADRTEGSRLPQKRDLAIALVVLARKYTANKGRTDA